MRTTGIEVPGVSTVRSWPVRRVAAVLLTVMALGVASASADQSSAPKTPATTQKPAARARKQTASAKASPAAQPATPPQADPLLPLWPANNHPSDATIVWNSQGLRIDASNSSLQQILKDVSTDIGVKITGITGEQRIFGAYGPGSARDVLSQLLDGSGYNVLMVGELGQGTPRQVVLTRKPTGPAPPVVNNSNSSNDDSSADVEEPPQHQPPPQQPPPNMPAGFGPGAQPRTPQQILQEMQQRQQQIEQQQLQQQQQRANPPQ